MLRPVFQSYLNRMTLAQLRSAYLFLRFLAATHKNAPRVLWPIFDLAGAVWAWWDGES